MKKILLVIALLVVPSFCNSGDFGPSNFYGQVRATGFVDTNASPITNPTFYNSTGTWTAQQYFNQNVGIGTNVPLTDLHVFSPAGTTGPQMIVSTGTTNLLEVNGSSVVMNVSTLSVVGGRISDKTGFVMPVGSIIAYGGNSAPSGWLLCDGSTVSRTTYSDLFIAISTSFGYGNNSTTFNIPDLRGRFLRGRDSGTARDTDSASRTAMNTGGATGDAVGSIQTDAFQGHKHGLYSGDGGAGTNTITYHADDTIGSVQIGSSWMSGVLTESNGTPRIASETRPINANVNYIIKY